MSISPRIATLPALSRPAAYLSLSKPDVTFLVAITTFAGFYAAAPQPVNWLALVQAVLATTLVAAGTAALNHYLERDSDARMRRTAARPLPSRALAPREAVIFGFALIVAGTAYLWVALNALSALLALATSLTYLCLYTPLKKRTTLATLVGAFPGAAPPLIGWAAATGRLTFGAWVLFAILFLWQFPHFMAIAWMYREDYSRAEIRMLPVVDPSGDATFRQVLVTAAALVPVSLLPSVIGIAGMRYFFGALVLSLALMQVCLWAARRRSNSSARWLMHATVLHLPLLFALLMFDKISR